MTGVVLCGGHSTRMGTDKGLLKWQGRTWAQTAAEILSVLQCPVVFSVNPQQFTPYAKIFTPASLVTDNASLSLAGPLQGLLSVHLRFPEEDIFMLACDMPLMQADMVVTLLRHAEASPLAAAVVYSINGKPEPLCALYRAAGLRHVLQMAHQQQLRKHSMKYMLEQVSAVYIPVASEQQEAFSNFNTPAALKAGKRPASKSR